MKRLLAAMFALVAVASTYCSAHAALGGACNQATENVRWRTSAAATVGVFTDSTVFKETGAANATEDTTAWVNMNLLCPWSGGFASAGDSTVYATLTISPVATDPYSGTAFGTGADSLYAYFEGTNDPSTASGRILTNLTEILTLETNSDNTFSFKITYARAALALNGYAYLRVRVRGDLNGCWRGTLTYWKKDL